MQRPGIITGSIRAYIAFSNLGVMEEFFVDNFPKPELIWMKPGI